MFSSLCCWGWVHACSVVSFRFQFGFHQPFLLAGLKERHHIGCDGPGPKWRSHERHIIAAVKHFYDPSRLQHLIRADQLATWWVPPCPGERLSQATLLPNALWPAVGSEQFLLFRLAEIDELYQGLVHLYTVIIGTSLGKSNVELCFTITIL